MKKRTSITSTLFFIITITLISQLITWSYAFSLKNDGPPLSVDKQPLSFRGLEWGSSAGILENKVLVDHSTIYADDTYNSEESKRFVRKNENLSIGDATLKEIIYYFYKDQLYVALITFEGNDNYQILKEKCIKDFGDPSNIFKAESIELLDWINSSLEIALQFSPKACWLRFRYLPVSKELEDDFESKTKEQVKDGPISTGAKSVSLKASTDTDPKNVFTGTPKTRAIIEPADMQRFTLSPKEQKEFQSIITLKDNRFYWTSRENREMIHHFAGAFHYFIDPTGGGYVKIGPGSLYPGLSNASYAYMEVLSLGLSAYIYFGSGELKMP